MNNRILTDEEISGIVDGNSIYDIHEVINNLLAAQDRKTEEFIDNSDLSTTIQLPDWAKEKPTGEWI